MFMSSLRDDAKDNHTTISVLISRQAMPRTVFDVFLCVIAVIVQTVIPIAITMATRGGEFGTVRVVHWSSRWKLCAILAFHLVPEIKLYVDRNFVSKSNGDHANDLIKILGADRSISHGAEVGEKDEAIPTDTALAMRRLRSIEAILLALFVPVSLDLTVAVVICM
jgi:hypothetical protein